MINEFHINYKGVKGKSWIDLNNGGGRTKKTSADCVARLNWTNLNAIIARRSKKNENCITDI
jgi:nitric oxide synthase oxygenase domain/subunit